MTFPAINHIDDVLPHIAGRSEFIVAQRDGYQVIDYNFALADSFDDPMRLECRGIKFAPGGRIIARPLHKFMNLGETAATQPHVLDFSLPHVVTEKLDGSMIHACLVEGEVVFMTRMGRTDVARKAERHLDRHVETECRGMLDAGLTPIFEFTAPDNRIVIRYDESKLSMLAVRDNLTGEYLDRRDYDDACSFMGIDIVTHHLSDWNSGQAFLDYARSVTGREGFVVRFDNGLWVKAKGEDYVLKHKAKESVLQEKNVLALILSGGLDDVLPLLDADDRAAIERYRDEVLNGIGERAQVIDRIVADGAHLDQKTFALNHMAIIDERLRPLAFQVRAGKPSVLQVQATLLKATGSQTAVDAARHLHGAQWAL